MALIGVRRALIKPTKPLVVAGPLALDGTPVIANATATTVSVTFSTTGSSGRVIAFVLANDLVTSVTGGGLSWSRRATVSGATPIEEWSATYSSQLSGVSITANLNSATFATIGVFAVSGGVGGFDTNVALPSTSASSTVAITTTAANSLIYAGYRFSAASPTAGAGWTQMFGSNFMLVEYQIVSVTQSATVATIAVGNTLENGGIGDAVK